MAEDQMSFEGMPADSYKVSLGGAAGVDVGDRRLELFGRVSGTFKGRVTKVIGHGKEDEDESTVIRTATIYVEDLALD